MRVVGKDVVFAKEKFAVLVQWTYQWEQTE